MSKQRNFYEVLNSTPNSTFDELKRNYKLLILQCHPDKLQQDKMKEVRSVDGGATVDPNVVAVEVAVADDDDDDNAEFVMINKAWNTLKDPLKRKHYDAELLLTKFQMHSNIFERLTLDDMMEHEEEEEEEEHEDETETKIETKTAAEAVEVENVAEKQKIAYDKNDEAQHKIEINLSPESKRISYIYTYDCRCGGQYIIDESAAANNGIYKSADLNKIMSLVDHKCTQRNFKQNIDCDNTCQETDDAAAAAANATSAFPTADAEVMVECSECSLVIMLSNKMKQQQHQQQPEFETYKSS